MELSLNPLIYLHFVYIALLLELFSQVNLLSKKLFPSRYSFGRRYCDLKKIKINIKGGGERTIDDYKGSKNLNELRILLESTIMIRRLKKDVLDELPSKTRQIVRLNHYNLIVVCPNGCLRFSFPNRWP